MAPTWPTAVLENAKAVRLVVFDVDGVLTDGTLAYGPEGEVVKHFNVKDGVGIKLLQHHDIAVAVISAKGSPALDRRMADLGVEHYFPNTKDKWPVLASLLAQCALSPEQVAYVGDDVIDLKVMRRIGVPLCPADAFWLVQEHAHVLNAQGGCGVAREVCDLLLSAQLGDEHTLADCYTKAMLPEFERPYS